MQDIANSQSLSREEIERRLDDLPMLPSVVVDLARLDPNADDFATQVRRIAESDPPLAVRILAVANSAAHAPVSAITSIESGLTRLGAMKVAGIVTSLAVMRVFVPTTDGHRDLWRHAIQVAITARIIAKASALKIEPGTAYLLGLLHDIGRFVMFEHDPNELNAVENKKWDTPDDLIATEQSLCGFDHAQLGATACAHWGLPDDVASVIAAHHSPREEWPEGLGQEVEIVQIADRVSCLLMHHPEFTDLDRSDQLEILERVSGISRDAKTPIPLSLLAEKLAGIQTETIEQATMLGLD